MLAELTLAAVAADTIERDEFLMELRREIRLRYEYWPIALGQVQSAWGCSVLAGIAIGIVALALIEPVIAFLAFSGLVAYSIWAVSTVQIAPRPKEHALRKAFLDGTCIDCGYDLAGVPDAIDPGLLDGIDIGPAACPECGASWPRVPPRVPAAFDEPLEPAQRGASLDSSGSSTNSS